MIQQLIANIIDTFIAMAPYMLLGLFFAGILHVFINKDLVLRHLGGNTIGSVVKAAIFGIPLPLCSCGVLPVAMSLRKRNASDGATVSFLISTPQTGADSIIATWGMMGPVYAIFRPFAALVMGITGGIVTNFIADKRTGTLVVKVQKFECSICYNTTPHSHSMLQKIKRVITYAFGEFFDDISPHLALGMIISGIIAFAIPADFFGKYVHNELLSMLLMVAIGIPMYTCVTASIPVAVALMFKGLSPGAAFVFLTVGPATNFSFIAVIAKVMGKKILSVYLAVLAVMSIIMGFVLNGIFRLTGKQSLDGLLQKHFCQHTSVWEQVFSWIFLAVLVLSFYRIYWPSIVRFFGGKAKRAHNSCSIVVDGMSCKNCARKVSEAVKKVSGVEDVVVDVDNGTATVQGHADQEELKKVIREAGYTVKEQ